MSLFIPSKISRIANIINTVRNVYHYTNQAISYTYNIAASCTKGLFSLGILYPARHVYYRSYWSSMNSEDICASLTRVDAGFWKQNENKCLDLIDRDFMKVFWENFAWIYFGGLTLFTFTAMCILLCRRRK